MVFQNRKKGAWDGIEKAAMMGTNFVAHILVGLALGYLFDFKWFPGLRPWGLLFWLVMGIVAGFRVMYLDAVKLGKTQQTDATGEEEAKKPEDSGEPAKNSGSGEESAGKNAGRESLDA